MPHRGLDISQAHVPRLLAAQSGEPLLTAYLAGARI